MRYDQIVLVNDEHVPLPVHALGAVVVGEGGVQALGLVAGDGASDEVPGVLGGGRPGRNGGDGVLGRIEPVGQGLDLVTLEKLFRGVQVLGRGEGLNVVERQKLAELCPAAAGPATDDTTQPSGDEPVFFRNVE